jgi:hypothetical protein
MTACGGRKAPWPQTSGPQQNATVSGAGPPSASVTTSGGGGDPGRQRLPEARLRGPMWRASRCRRKTLRFSTAASWRVRDAEPGIFHAKPVVARGASQTCSTLMRGNQHTRGAPDRPAVHSCPGRRRRCLANAAGAAHRMSTTASESAGCFRVAFLASSFDAQESTNGAS